MDFIFSQQKNMRSENIKMHLGFTLKIVETKYLPFDNLLWGGENCFAHLPLFQL